MGGPAYCKNGVRGKRWLGELAQVLKEEPDRPDPITRAYIPKANGKLLVACRGWEVARQAAP